MSGKKRRVVLVALLTTLCVTFGNEVNGFNGFENILRRVGEDVKMKQKNFLGENKSANCSEIRYNCSRF